MYEISLDNLQDVRKLQEVLKEGSGELKLSKKSSYSKINKEIDELRSVFQKWLISDEKWHVRRKKGKKYFDNLLLGNGKVSKT